MVRKVVAYELLSLDGVAEQPDEFVTDFDDVMREKLGRVIATQDAVLLGRRTYNDWAGFWPQRPLPDGLSDGRLRGEDLTSEPAHGESVRADVGRRGPG